MITFLRPEWLLLAPLVVLVPLVMRARRTPWRALVDPDLLPHLLVGRGGRREAWPWLLLAAAYLAAVVALAGPALPLPESEAITRIKARVIVLDLSPSMDAADIAPSRVARARFKIRDLLERSDDAHHGLVAFAGDAFVVSPVTEDSATLVNLLDALSTRVMPVAGDRFDRAMTLALDLLARSQNAGAEILLVTDGVGASASGQGARSRRAGAVLNVIAVGSADGAPIPAGDGGFLSDEAGNIVVAGVDHAALAELAREGGGVAVRMTAGDDDLDLVAAGDISLAGAEALERPDTVVRHRDVGPYLVLLLLPAALAAFRRGWLLVLLPLAAMPPDAAAFGWDELWARADQRAARDFAAGDHAAAAAHGDTPWLGAARYSQGDYEGAAQAFSGDDSADGLYNLGNALARAGRLSEALETYDAALAKNPDDADARYNRDLVADLLDQQNAAGGGQSPPGSTDPQQGADDGDREAASADGGQGAPRPGRDGTGGDSLDQAGDDATAGTGEGASDADAAAAAGEPPGERGDEATAGSSDEGRPAEGTPGDAAAETGVAASPAGDDGDGAARQALEQWLRQVPDDPEGLLRRKFLHQYRMRQGAL